MNHNSRLAASLANIFSLLALALIVASCAAPQLRATDDGERVFESIPAALAALSPTGTLSPGASTKLVISEKKSPSLKQGRLNNRFEILEVNGRKGQPFIFTTLAVCDCLGFRKWAVFAAPSLVDQTGQVVAHDKPGYAPEMRTIDGVFPEDGRYYLVVVADRKFEGSEMGQIAATGLTGLPIMGIPLTVHPTGDLIVQWIATK